MIFVEPYLLLMEDFLLWFLTNREIVTMVTKVIIVATTVAAIAGGLRLKTAEPESGVVVAERVKVKRAQKLLRDRFYQCHSCSAPHFRLSG